MNKKMYVDVTEVCEDWGVSRAQGYKIIKQLNDRMLAINPNLMVLSGKANRKFYEENCYGMAKKHKKYNYWRNLYGCKWYALSIYGILAIREILMVDKFSIADIFRNPIPKYTMLLVLVVWSILFCSIVSQKTVKRNAFDYAKTLLETVDVMSGDLEA